MAQVIGIGGAAMEERGSVAFDGGSRGLPVEVVSDLVGLVAGSWRGRWSWGMTLNKVGNKWKIYMETCMFLRFHV